LNLFYSPQNDATGWHDPKYDMLDAANKELDEQKACC